jgi:hypothetical protein
MHPANRDGRRCFAHDDEAYAIALLGRHKASRT